MSTKLLFFSLSHFFMDLVAQLICFSMAFSEMSNWGAISMCLYPDFLLSKRLPYFS
ncbi:hypothetical protein [Arenibacter palladensis]|uniref:hypothetical protein n=1 Tax=Arenibacter palladensis TaxID=237373 RepID=UPI0015B42D7C|nr:hypothetical protein [Arenibacter palladensis]